MLDFSIVGPIVGGFAFVDVFVHLYLDMKKSRTTGNAMFTEPQNSIPSCPMAAVAISTLLAFFLVGCIPLVWLANLQQSFLSLQVVFLSDVPEFLWVPGFFMLLFGIFLQAWSRYVRQEMAASWKMREDHMLITNGPYSRVRHPSYSSYFISFIGLFLMMPSVVTLVPFIGFWGYNKSAIIEEKNLLQHFGGAYKEYMNRTGRFFPKIL